MHKIRCWWVLYVCVCVKIKWAWIHPLPSLWHSAAFSEWTTSPSDITDASPEPTHLVTHRQQQQHLLPASFIFHFPFSFIWNWNWVLSMNVDWTVFPFFLFLPSRILIGTVVLRLTRYQTAVDDLLNDKMIFLVWFLKPYKTCKLDN